MDDGSVERDYRVTAMPSTFVIDKRGRVAATYVGVVDSTGLLQKVLAVVLNESKSTHGLRDVSIRFGTFRRNWRTTRRGNRRPDRREGEPCVKVLPSGQCFLFSGHCSGWRVLECGATRSTCCAWRSSRSRGSGTSRGLRKHADALPADHVRKPSDIHVLRRAETVDGSLTSSRPLFNVCGKAWRLWQKALRLRRPVTLKFSRVGRTTP